MDEKLLQLSEEHPIVFFDGVCGFCNLCVQSLLKWDRQRIFRYLPLQDPRAAEVASKVTDTKGNLTTLVLLYRRKFFIRSEAVIEMGKHLPTFRSLALLMGGFPSPFLDVFYRAISKSRFALWRKPVACRIPAEGEKELFL